MCHGHFACDCHTDLTRTACPSCGAEGGIELYLDGCSECLCRTYDDGVALVAELAGTGCARTHAACGSAALDSRCGARARIQLPAPCIAPRARRVRTIAACATYLSRCAHVRCDLCGRDEEPELVDVYDQPDGTGIAMCHVCQMGQHDAADVAFELWVAAVEAEAPDAQPWSLAWEPPANDVANDAA